MTFRLVDRHWDTEFTDALRRDSGTLRMVCPFIKARALERILTPRPDDLEVITRFNLADFASGASDIDALGLLLDVGGAVRGLKGLHAKLYIFGTSRAIITSANLTGAGLSANHEFGVVTEDSAAIRRCHEYFETLWRSTGSDLQRSQLADWTRKLSSHLEKGAPPADSDDLEDFGAVPDFGPSPINVHPPQFVDAPQAFVKFLGESRDRVPLNCPTIEEVDRAGCHWALAYPAGSRRPTGVENGAVMFVSRLVKGPDIQIFGRAVALRHEAGRDDATDADIARRIWKKRWPRYIRVHNAEFVAGTMQNGVALSELMDALGSDSFAPTQRNASKGEGNTNPRRSIMQKAHIKLSNEGFEWLNARLQNAFDTHGRLPDHDLGELDWPEIPVHASQFPKFTQQDFDSELRRMLEAERRAGRTSTRIVARDLHRNVVGGTDPNRMPMACDAMWKLWKRQGSIPDSIVQTTKSGQSSTTEVEFSTARPGRG